jgi:ribosomal protein S8
MNNLITLCNKLKNAVHLNVNSIWVRETKLINQFTKLLFKEGFIYSMEKQGKFLKILSKSKKHLYIDYNNLGKIIKLDSLFLLTNKGLLIGDDAVKKKRGGKILCSIF